MLAGAPLGTEAGAPDFSGLTPFAAALVKHPWRAVAPAAARTDAVTIPYLAELMQSTRSPRGDLSAPFSLRRPLHLPSGYASGLLDRNPLNVSPQCSAANCMSPAQIPSSFLPIGSSFPPRAFVSTSLPS